MIVVTGGAGLIGSAFVWKLNEQGIDDILIVDDLGTDEKWRNLVPRRYADYLHKSAFREQIRAGRFDQADISAIVHMGACSSTFERDGEYLMDNNYRFTRDLAEWAVGRNIRFIYASSAATYGDGALGFADDEARIPELRPLNMYGYSKQVFDLWALRTGMVRRMAGLKFFNVFGPNEYHKGAMTSVPFNAFHQITASGELKLFKSYKPEYADGEQRRDFVYVKDCVEVMWWLLQQPDVNGIFNVGTGQSRSWNELGQAVFAAMERPTNIQYIEMPEGMRAKYQYYTQASMGRLQAAGCPVTFRSLEESIRDYVTGYLAHENRCL